ncbi:MAG: quinolinate synthase NadA [Endomicrobiales bacterium]|nr:quinolinate synthase NadA [Endomicrobiales bacterium]
MNRLIDKILDLKKKRNAIFLVHNYQPPEIQNIADILGDSLDLSRKAKESSAKTIVFCGVHFMAETASILCPDKEVLLPELAAGCPMADMVTGKKLRDLKKKHPGVPVVCYINTTAEVKAESDICCTSANAVKIVNSIDADKIIFVPDKNLGHYVSTKTKKDIILWDGYCPVHVAISARHVLDAKKKHPNAEVLAHPECTPDVVDLADKILSTTGICAYAKESKNKEFIIGTELGIIYRLKKENPDKSFYPASESAVCQNMKKITLEKILWALEDMKFKVTVEENISKKAIGCIDKMLKLSI